MSESYFVMGKLYMFSNDRRMADMMMTKLYINNLHHRAINTFFEVPRFITADWLYELCLSIASLKFCSVVLISAKSHIFLCHDLLRLPILRFQKTFLS